jgi:hypothetical protein
MATLQTSPSLLISSVPAIREGRSTLVTDPRPYLVTGPQHRKPAKTTQNYLALFPHESEDARLTGATRSLYRRLLALNLPGRIARPATTSAAVGEVAKSVFAGFKIA